MKKILIPGIFITCIGVASAATVKCIAFNTQTACTYDNPYDYVDFTAYCGGITVRGLGYCSEQSGSSVGSTTMDLEKSKGIYCWCRMVSPALSNWVYLESAMDSSQCVHTCSIDCAIALNDSRTKGSSMRQGMFNSAIY